MRKKYKSDTHASAHQSFTHRVWLQVELILSLAALSKGLYDVVAMSLIGSVLSNLLLVLGESVVSACTLDRYSYDSALDWLYICCALVWRPHAQRLQRHARAQGGSHEHGQPLLWCLYAGCCFLVGGTQYHSQRFNAGINKVGSASFGFHLG